MATMMALRAHARGGPEQLVYEQAPVPSAGPGEVLIAVHAAAITFAELTWDLEWTTRDGKDRTPVIPSHEMSGVVAALGTGVTGVAVPRHRSVHVTPAVTKAAAGAVEHLQMALVAGMPSALQQLERLGVMTVGLDEGGTTSLYDLELGDRPVALVLGSEGSGLSPLSRRRCEVLCRIPVEGEIPSLNVSAAAAVACFEVARQRTSPRRR